MQQNHPLGESAMGERSEKLYGMSTTEFVAEYRTALSGLVPSYIRLDCIHSDSETYDEFDEVAELLWEQLVINSIVWRDGLETRPSLPRYGFSELGSANHYIEAQSGRRKGRMICLTGEASYCSDLFNAVVIDTVLEGDWAPLVFNDTIFRLVSVA